MPMLEILEAAANVPTAEPDVGPTALEAEMLLNRLAMLVEQLRYAISTRPEQVAQLKGVGRMLECACRTAFADKELWGRLARKPDVTSTRPVGGRGHGAPRPRPVLKLRAGGVDRASSLLDQAADRLVQLGSH